MVVIPDIADRSNLVDRNPEQQVLEKKEKKTVDVYVWTKLLKS